MVSTILYKSTSDRIIGRDLLKTIRTIVRQTEGRK